VIYNKMEKAVFVKLGLLLGLVIAQDPRYR